MHGRHDLPWQADRDPYRIWVSEIMLQQTQVGTVIPYYTRFLERFPTVASLAEAPVDAVLALWSGLGYYARARNLHRAAVLVVEQHDGTVPDDFDTLVELPGIGRSTAGAILAQAHGRRHAILDGNVRRVLARFHAIEGWSGKADVLRELWSRAESHTPATDVAAYTQAIMDLGATLCTRGRPRCEACPVSAGCIAHAQGLESELPTPRKRAARPSRAVTILVVQNAVGETLLERRAATGVWGGLLSFPELGEDDDARSWCRRHLGLDPKSEEPLAAIDHAFTHFDLTLNPLRLVVRARDRMVMDGDQWLWYNSGEPLPGGVASPIGKLLREVTASESLQ